MKYYSLFLIIHFEVILISVIMNDPKKMFAIPC